MADLVPQLRSALPAIVQDAGEETSERVIEFFTAELRNSNTRKPTPGPSGASFGGQPGTSSIYRVLSRSTSPHTSKKTTAPRQL